MFEKKMLERSEIALDQHTEKSTTCKLLVNKNANRNSAHQFTSNYKWFFAQSM